MYSPFLATKSTGTWLMAALQDEDWWVRLIAAAHPNASEQVKLAAARDEHPWVREAAR
jgi:hypothetical protein